MSSQGGPFLVMTNQKPAFRSCDQSLHINELRNLGNTNWPVIYETCGSKFKDDVISVQFIFKLSQI